MLQPSIYRLRLEDILTVCVLGLLCLGILMVQSAAMNVTGQIGWHWNERGSKHLIFVAVALIAFFAIGHLDYRILERKSGWRTPVLWMLAVALFTCVIVLVPHVGTQVKGARRWLPLGFTQVQPSELGKWGVVLFLTWVFCAHAKTHGSKPMSFRKLILVLVPVGMICLLVVIEDFGTAFLIGLCALTILIAARVKGWHLAVLIPLAVGAAVLFVMLEPYRVRRFRYFWNPFAAPEREGYHMIQSLLSFSTGGIFGTGLGRGVQKLGYLPEDTTDFIFAVICEELGVFGAILTIALYMGILYVAAQAIKQRKASGDGFGQLLAFGIGAMITLQALINIAVATVSVPPKGMSLPLVSAGGSGLVITSAALGLLYSVCRSRPEEVADMKARPNIGKAALALGQ